MPKLQINDFSGGLNTQDAQNLIKDNESPTHQNVWVYDKGTLTKRQGISTLASSVGTLAAGMTTKCYHFTRANDSSGVSRLYIQANNTNTDTNSGSFELDTAYATLASTVLNGCGRLFNNFLVSTQANLLSGGNATASNLKRWNPTDTNVDVPIAPQTSTGGLLATQCIFHDSLFFTGNSGNPSDTAILDELHWSDTAKFTTFSKDNKVIIGYGDGMTISRAIPYQDVLIIFKSPLKSIVSSSTKVSTSFQSSRIFKLIGTSTQLQNIGYQVVELPFDRASGCCFGGTVCEWQGGLVFLTNTGVYLYDGNTFNLLTEKITNTIKNWYNFTNATPNTFTDSNMKLADGFVYRNNYFLTVAESGSTGNTAADNKTNALFVFRPDGSMWRWNSTLGLASISYDQADAVVASSVGGSAGSNTIALYQLFSTSYVDGTSAIDASYTTKEFDLKAPVFFKNIHVDFRGQKSGILGVEYNVDQHGWVKRTVDMSSGYSDIKRSQRLMVGQSGRTIQFRLSNNQAYVNFEIYEIACEYTPLDPNAEITQAKAINVTENS